MVFAVLFVICVAFPQDFSRFWEAGIQVPGTRIRREAPRPQEAPGGAGKLPEVPGSSRRFREALGFPSKTVKNITEKQQNHTNPTQ